MITKSKFLSYLQCARRLWLEEYQPGLAQPPDDAGRRRMRQGQEVDRLARSWFPDGQHIPYRSDPLEMVVLTSAAMAAGAEGIFQGTFHAEDLLVKVDILLRMEPGWHLIEVKSSTKAKEDEHLPDAAFQLYVLERAGVPISRVSIMHLNSACRYPALDDLFTLTDVTADARAWLPVVSEGIVGMRATLDEEGWPQVDIGRHCSKPVTCPLRVVCWQDIHELTIFDIARLSPDREQQLRSEGVLYLSDIPADFPLSTSQREFVRRITRREVSVDRPAVRLQLDSLEYPLHFLDFETIDHAVPVFEGCGPYRQVPFQFSCHVLDENGVLRHVDYLHTEDSDPRPALVESLLDTIGERGHVIAYYATFERQRLQELAADFPEHARRLLDIAGRLWDQYEVFRRHYQHHGFGKSRSLKSVLPVIVPELSYDSLAVQDGSRAQVVWEEMIVCPDDAEKRQMSADLRAYCRLDTLAMVKIHDALAAL